MCSFFFNLWRENALSLPKQSTSQSSTAANCWLLTQTDFRFIPVPSEHQWHDYVTTQVLNKALSLIYKYVCDIKQCM